MAKLLTGNKDGQTLPATGPAPADYPLGSIKSRAAARAMLERRTALSTADRDALTLYGARDWLDPHGSVGLERDVAYQRGKELHEVLYGHEDGSERWELERERSLASLEFQYLRGRPPIGGDILRRGELLEYHRRRRQELFDELISAWHRSISELPCPLKFEGECVFVRVNPNSNESAEWREAFTWDRPEAHWNFVESDINIGTLHTKITAVKFIDSNRGRAVESVSQ